MSANGSWPTRELHPPDPPPNDFVQVERMANPLFNEFIIGPDVRDEHRTSAPSGDSAFQNRVLNPEIPVYFLGLFGLPTPATPRDDLQDLFLRGMSGLNQPASVVPADVLRLNTSTPPTLPGSQSRLGVLGNDNAGYPNGRRPGDDTVDIFFLGLEGAFRPGGNVPPVSNLGDGVDANDVVFQNMFPYVADPHLVRISGAVP